MKVVGAFFVVLGLVVFRGAFFSYFYLKQIPTACCGWAKLYHHLIIVEIIEIYSHQESQLKLSEF